AYIWVIVTTINTVTSRIFRFTPFLAEPVYLLPSGYQSQIQTALQSQYSGQRILPYLYDPYYVTYQYDNEINSGKHLESLKKKPTIYNIPALANGLFNGKIKATGPKAVINIPALANGLFT
ncbi:hypothetical protein QYM36_010424, partial [Artemia franciscana]